MDTFQKLIQADIKAGNIRSYNASDYERYELQIRNALGIEYKRRQSIAVMLTPSSTGRAAYTPSVMKAKAKRPAFSYQQSVNTTLLTAHRKSFLVRRKSEKFCGVASCEGKIFEGRVESGGRGSGRSD